MLVPPLARVSNIEIWGSAKLPTGWVVTSYSTAASGTAWSADGREAYPSPYEGTANDVINRGAFSLEHGGPARVALRGPARNNAAQSG